eukprot:1821045-Rhodomonas_salina.1
MKTWRTRLLCPEASSLFCLRAKRQYQTGMTLRSPRAARPPSCWYNAAISYARPTRCPALTYAVQSGRRIGRRGSRYCMPLRACYAVSGTDLAYAATRKKAGASPPRCSWYKSTRYAPTHTLPVGPLRTPHSTLVQRGLNR